MEGGLADPGQRARDQGDQDVRPGRGPDRGGVETVQDVDGHPRDQARVSTDSPPMWLRGRQASQRWRSGRAPRRAEVARAEATTASWVRTTPLGWPVLPLVAMTRASPSATARLVTEAPAALGPDDPGRAQDLEQGGPGGRGQAPVERGDGVARLPGLDERVHEVRPARQVYCDEVGHLG